VESNSGYRYKIFEGHNAVEYHVDSTSVFQERADQETQLWGFFSVQVENDKLFGQDESVLKQYHMTKSAWVAPDETMTLVPKEDGHGVMLSAFECHIF
jgi:hypothetical protein